VLVVSVVSLKGGVGKTSVVLGLAGAGWERGLRMLVVDLDPQANASTVLDPPAVTYTTNDVLADARAGVLGDAVARSGWGPQVDVVPAEPALEHRNRVDASTTREGALRLRIAMDGLVGYDVVLVDSPPSLGELTKNALAASHRALVVTEPTLFALHGAQQALDAVDVVRSGYNLRLRPAGIVVNRTRAQQTEHAYRLEELAAAYGELLFTPPLPDRAAVQQAEGAYVPVQAWRSAGARELGQIFEDYLDRLLTTDERAGPLVASAHADLGGDRG
jgi:chromosome partitioning protein